MNKSINTIDKISKMLALMAAIFLSISVVLIFTEIILRTFFNLTLFITAEYAGYTMSILTFLGVAYTLSQDSHIRIKVIYSKLSGRNKIVCDLINYTIGFILCAYIFRATSSLFYSSLVKQTRSVQVFATYLAIPQFFLPLGSGMMMLQYLSKFVKSFSHLKNYKGEIE